MNQAIEGALKLPSTFNHLSLAQQEKLLNYSINSYVIW